MGQQRKRHDAGHFKLHVRKGDSVLILAGKDAGKRGRILQAFPQRERVTVEDVNVVIRHQRPRSTQIAAQQQAGRVEKPAPIHVSNVMLVCPSCNQPTRIAHKQSENHSVRACKHCGEIIDKQR
jgi:large subunit ribosomal protein L24